MPGGTTLPGDSIPLPALLIPKEHDYAPSFERTHSDTTQPVHFEDERDASEVISDTDTDATNSSDEFNWDEEEEEAKEAHRIAGTKAKRGRLLYLGFMKLARPVRVILLGIIGAGILIAPLVVVELKFKSSPARPQVHVWSLWLSIIWAASCVTYIVVDSLPRLSVALIILFGGQVERLKTEVEVRIILAPVSTLIDVDALQLVLAVSVWLKLFVDISCAWIALGALVDFYHPDGGYWPIINHVIEVGC